MKTLIVVIIIIFLFGCSNDRIPGDIRQQYPLSLQFEVENPLPAERPDELVMLELPVLQEKYPDFNPAAFVAFSGKEELPGQAIDSDGDSQPDQIGILMHLPPSAKQKVLLRYAREGQLMRDYPKRTQAELSVKEDGRWNNRKYEGGRFVNVNFLRVPPEHTDHSFYIRYEGPGWESDKVGYRFYLDWRNAIDIFGKKTPEMVLQNVGQDGFDSYHEMAEWGADIFKVGNSLGVGSPGMWSGGRVHKISVTDSITCRVLENGPVYSAVQTRYSGWQVAEEKLDVISGLSITAGSRLTRHHIRITGEPENLCTGLAKYPGTVYLQSDPKAQSGWHYIALWGEQSLAGDSLGIALLYHTGNLLQITGDDLNHLTILKTLDGKLTYYFLAAWEKEPGGITTENEFRNYLEETVRKLNQPLKVNL